jgi:hypothetical protein
MTTSKLAPAAVLTVLAAAALGSFVTSAPAASSAPRPPRMVYVRGPIRSDCDFERQRARARNDEAGLFVAEFKCKVQQAWDCAAACKADELLVSHITVRVAADGKPAEPQVVQKSDTAAFEQLSVAAIKAGAPYPAPPAALTDAGGAPLKIEFVCDCAQRAPAAK